MYHLNITSKFMVGYFLYNPGLLAILEPFHGYQHLKGFLVHQEVSWA